jgi:hypothetical protein
VPAPAGQLVSRPSGCDQHRSPRVGKNPLDQARRRSATSIASSSAHQFAHVLFAKRWSHSSHLNSWQSLPPSTRPCATVPHSGQIMQVSLVSRSFAPADQAGQMTSPGSPRARGGSGRLDDPGVSLRTNARVIPRARLQTRDWDCARRPWQVRRFVCR